MTPHLEAAARAIFAELYYGAWEAASQGRRKECERLATAALRAMMGVPITKDMFHAADFASMDSAPDDEWGGYNDVWRALLGAVIEGEQ